MKQKTKTISLGKFQYAQVKERLKEFREANTHGLIETTPTISDTHVVFKARIVKDKSDEGSAEATGHSYGEIKKGEKLEKLFEKQETIAVGRALALLGYAADGEIASSEEMEEFEAYQREQREALILEYTERIDGATTLEELKDVWASIDGTCRVELNEIKNNKKKTLDEKVTTTAK